MSFDKKTIRNIDVAGKTVLLRTDYNVVVNSQGKIEDAYRIRMTLPTIEHLLGLGAKVVVLSHMGRPNGKKDLNLSLLPTATCLSDLLHLPVKFIPEITGAAVKQQIGNMPSCSVAMLENLRFWPGEENNDQDFIKHLASLGDVFVQDAFAAAYREHASIVGLPQCLPAVAGFLLEREITNLSDKFKQSAEPVALIVGGIKVADKLPVIEHFLDKSSFIAVGGVVANTFLAAEGHKMGKCTIEADHIAQAKSILRRANELTKKQPFTFMLPKDVVVAKNGQHVAPLRVIDLGMHTWADISSYPKIPKSASFELSSTDTILDIGPMTAAAISGALKMTKTAVWCGPLGAAEIKGFNQAEPPFSHGSRIVAEAMVGERSGQQNKPYSIAGGGNTINMLNSFGLGERFDFLSTGGGACLQVLAGQKLVGVEALANKEA